MSYTEEQVRNIVSVALSISRKYPSFADEMIAEAAVAAAGAIIRENTAFVSSIDPEKEAAAVEVSPKEKCSYGFVSAESCRNCSNGYCTASVLTSLPPKFGRCVFADRSIPQFKPCSEVTCYGGNWAK